MKKVPKYSLKRGKGFLVQTSIFFKRLPILDKLMQTIIIANKHFIQQTMIDFPVLTEKVLRQ